MCVCMCARLYTPQIRTEFTIERNTTNDDGGTLENATVKQAYGCQSPTLLSNGADTRANECAWRHRVRRHDSLAHARYIYIYRAFTLSPL